MGLRLQFNVHGIVQGVGFRYFTWRKACELGLKGNVRNLSDGSVLVIAEGDGAQVDSLRRWLQQGGPRSARVDRVLEQSYQGKKRFTRFEIEH
ncbi:acylphosphatase [Chelonobacter oris]|uniref:acylphosphatase n=1 Tax=Chelonobacter oris TaxID=505317 RepID=A0A0A3AN54_9PAST|nr:acylphosphatase [Chelonobacter oris]KGQ70756.1 acylphosphatase [Chelonobacter oris]MDH3001298.1 acylphosphatase [Chelonobacter oris]